MGYELRKDVDLAVALNRALCNTTWTKGSRQYSFTWRAAGEAVAWIRMASGCPAEDYLDYYLSGNEGYCEPALLLRLRGLGYTPS